MQSGVNMPVPLPVLLPCGVGVHVFRLSDNVIDAVWFHINYVT